MRLNAFSRAQVISGLLLRIDHLERSYAVALGMQQRNEQGRSDEATLNIMLSSLKRCRQLVKLYEQEGNR